jgi:hypothetical protein
MKDNTEDRFSKLNEEQTAEQNSENQENSEQRDSIRGKFSEINHEMSQPKEAEKYSESENQNDHKVRDDLSEMKNDNENENDYR